MLSRLSRHLFRFCETANKNIEKTGQSTLQASQKKEEELPVHLRPYNKAKFEVPLKKIKLNSGYAFLQIEPFPRAKLMKICYHIMHQLSIGYPQTSVFRIYQEQKTKYIMKMVDETEDIEQLQDILGTETIELYIDHFVNHIKMIKYFRNERIWELEDEEDFDQDYLQSIKKEEDRKNPAYKKPERPFSQFYE